jgi:hypothetical protein
MEFESGWRSTSCSSSTKSGQDTLLVLFAHVKFRAQEDLYITQYKLKSTVNHQKTRTMRARLSLIGS